MSSDRFKGMSRLLFRKRVHPTTLHGLSGTMVQRKRITSEAVDLHPKHSAKTNQAWKYKGGRIVRHASKMINGNPYVDPKDETQARRKQESNFFVTMNTNKAPTDSEITGATYALNQALEDLAQDSMLASYLRFGPKTEAYETDKYADVIESVQWKAAAETGDIAKRLHSQVWLTITHYSQIQIDPKLIGHLFRSRFNHHNKNERLRLTRLPYVHIKLLPQSDWTNVMRQYIHKGMMAS